MIPDAILALVGKFGGVKLLSMLVPLGLMYLARNYAKKVPGLLFIYFKRRWQDKLSKKEVDADLDELVHTWGIALVKYAEKKIPDQGMGPERMNLIIALMKNLPAIGWVFTVYEKECREFIQNFVKAFDEESKKALQVDSTPIPDKPK